MADQHEARGAVQMEWIRDWHFREPFLHLVDWSICSAALCWVSGRIEPALKDALALEIALQTVVCGSLKPLYQSCRKDRALSVLWFGGSLIFTPGLQKQWDLMQEGESQLSSRNLIANNVYSAIVWLVKALTCGILSVKWQECYRSFVDVKWWC